MCTEAKLVVEADGAQHADAEGYDRQRSEWLAREGFTTLRFWNNEILTNTQGVLTTILGHLPSPSHSASAERAPSSPPRGEEMLIPLPSGERKGPAPTWAREGEGQ